MNLPDRVAEFRKTNTFPDAPRKFILRQGNFPQDEMEQLPKNAGRNLTGCLVNRNDSTDMEAVFFVARKDLDFGLDHDAVAGGAIQFYFPEKGNTGIGDQAFCIALTVEPAGLERTVRSVRRVASNSPGARRRKRASLAPATLAITAAFSPGAN